MFKFASLKRMMRRFGGDQRGNVLMMTGFALVPLTGVVGVSVDYSRASNVRQALNSAIDAASLMAARDAQKLNDAQLKTRIDSWIRDNLPPDAKEAFTGAVVTINRTDRTIRIEANANMPTTIARVLGTQYIPVASNAQSTWGTNTIELALVLDNTGSMSSSGKMTALKTASKDLIKIMKDAALDVDQIKISIVPFNTQVRLARSFKDEVWMRYGLTRKVNCDRNGNNCSTETMTKAIWETNAQGCIADRDQDFDTTDGGDYTTTTQRYPAYWCGQSTLAEVLPLTSDWSALEARVNAMTPVGNTNVTIGAVWGMATLSPAAPFAEAKPSTEPRLKKYMILLTDGDNTENRFTTNGNSIDQRTARACTNIKNEGVNLYTIRVINGDENLLRGCASTPAMYYNVQNASQLSPIFKAIASEISAVRLTH